ncbi:MAG: 50S ribosomal protein L25 [Phycisphaeraceae bacterium]|nr:50S ribosomal protein L25 [Phycisphaeraceae bacterium]MCW5763136.1 50S ribosomal protein L25 [Phycisphaeraceae bacterium]
MKDQTPTLQATKRDRVGSRYSRRIRENGGLPAIVYGHGQEPMPITVDAKIALRHFYSGDKVFQLALEGDTSGGDHYILLKELQFDHLGTGIVHCDFARVDLTERVKVRVPLHLIGDAKGLKSVGAILMHPLETIELECLLTNLPDFIEVDVSNLDVGQILHASDLQLPLPTMVLLTDPHAIVAQIVVQVEQAETSGEAAELGAKTSEPEVVGRKPKPEDE